MYETSARIFVNLDCFLYRKGVIIDYIIHSMQMFFPFHLPRAHHVTCKYLTTNNVSAHVQWRPTVFGLSVWLSLAAIDILLMRKWNHAFLFLWSLLRKNGRSLRFPKIFIKKQIRSPNDKTDQ